jgi:hypothetical protein
LATTQWGTDCNLAPAAIVRITCDRVCCMNSACAIMSVVNNLKRVDEDTEKAPYCYSVRRGGGCSGRGWLARVYGMAIGAESSRTRAGVEAAKAGRTIR